MHPAAREGAGLYGAAREGGLASWGSVVMFLLSQESCLRWNAELANGDGFYPTVVALLRQHQSNTYAKELRVSGWQGRPLDVEGIDSWAKREQDIWQQAFKVNLELASARLDCAATYKTFPAAHAFSVGCLSLNC